MIDHDAADFFRALYGKMGDDEFVEMRAKRGNRTSRGYFQDMDKLAAAAKRLSGGNDVYFGVALRDGHGGKKANIKRITCLWADLDAKPGMEEPLRRIAESPLPPSAGVVSGKGMHFYWFLDESVGPDKAYIIEHLNKAIAKPIGGDAVWDVSRVLRVPGTLNWKYSEPIFVNLLGMKPDRRYTIEQMFSALGCDEPEPPLVNVHTLPVTPYRTAQLACRDEIWMGVTEGERNAACFQLAVDLKRSGMSLKPAMNALLDWNRLNKPVLDGMEVRETVKSVYAGSYTGLGCDKDPMKRLCKESCVVKKQVGGERLSVVGGEAVRGDKAKVDENVNPLPVWKPIELAGIGLNPPEFVVDKLVPARGVTMISGEGGIGKSFVVVDMACAVATGRQWLGRFKCRKKPVLMVDLENDEPTIARRLRKVAKGRGCVLRDLEVYIIRKGDMSLADLRIDNPRGRAMLEATIKNFKPGVLVIDPMVAIHGQDENNNIAMRQVVMTLEEFARAYELGVVIVHHHRKRGVINDAGQMMRGASDLRNAAVSHLSLRRAGKDKVSVDHDKCRQAETIDPFIIQITDSEDGEAISMTTIDAPVPESKKTKSDLAREVILEALGDGNVWERSNLLAMCVAQGLSAGTGARMLNMLTKEGTVLNTAFGKYTLQELEAA